MAHRHSINLNEGIEQKHMTVKDHRERSSIITGVTEAMPQAIRVTEQPPAGGGATRVSVDLEDVPGND